MQGLSEPAAKIIEAFSTLEDLKDYQLIGGTALSIKIDHRLSEDLDFCQWVPDVSQPKHGVNANQIHDRLKALFGEVDINHLGFSQVNYYIQDPGVKITFYHTDLKKPTDPPTDLIGNIKVATLEVLGGSKIYVITQRREIRDYYDNYVLLEKNHLTLELMLSKAALLSREAVPKRIHKIFSTVKFSDEDIKSMKALKPRYEMKKEEFNGFFHKMAAKIEQDYLQAKD